MSYAAGIGRVIVLAIGLLGLFGAVSQSAASAAESSCRIGSLRNLAGNALEATANRTCPPGPGGSDEQSEETPRERWETYCDTVDTYKAGHTVEIEPGAEVTSGVSFEYYSTSFDGHVGTPVTVEQITIPTGVRYFNHTISCQTPSGTTVQNVVLPEGAVPVSPIALRDEVRARIVIPGPAMAANPPLDDPNRFSVVRIATWLWIDDPWEPIVDAETRAGISVSVAATPIKVVWDTGDGSLLECADAGVPWRRGLSESATNCSHTYTRSSAGLPGDAYELSATVHWAFSWTLNGVPQNDFGTYESTTVVTHQVGEIQAVSR